jgi:hypothetical protein
MFWLQCETTQVLINTSKGSVGKSDTRDAARKHMQLTRLNQDSAYQPTNRHPPVIFNCLLNNYLTGNDANLFSKSGLVHLKDITKKRCRKQRQQM